MDRRILPGNISWILGRDMGIEVAAMFERNSQERGTRRVRAARKICSLYTNSTIFKAVI